LVLTILVAIGGKGEVKSRCVALISVSSRMLTHAILVASVAIFIQGEIDKCAIVFQYGSFRQTHHRLVPCRPAYIIYHPILDYGGLDSILESCLPLLIVCIVCRVGLRGTLLFSTCILRLLQESNVMVSDLVDDRTQPYNLLDAIVPHRMEAPVIQ
jgi:hypothetical protein